VVLQAQSRKGLVRAVFRSGVGALGRRKPSPDKWLCQKECARCDEPDAEHLEWKCSQGFLHGACQFAI